MNIKIAIADDHNLIVEGITKILSPFEQVAITATYATGRLLLEGLKISQPDVLLLDLHFPDTTGNELVRVIKPLYPEMNILVISSEEDPYEIKDMMQHGSSGYVQKTISADMLLEAIETVHSGGTFVQPSLKEMMVNSMLGQGNKQQQSIELSARELAILEMICSGLSSMEIGEKLFLSNRTIDNQRLALYQKFKVNNTASLVKMAVLHKLVK